MNLTLHLAAWDLRYLRHYLVLWLSLVILQAGLVGYAPHLFPVEIRGHFFSLSSFFWLVAVLKSCLLAVTVAQLVQKDSTIGGTAFWLSRPVSRARLLSSKVLFLVAAIILPWLLVEVGLLFITGVTPHDTLRSVPQIVFLTLLAVAILMMLAAVTTSLARMIFAGGVALLGLPLLWLFVVGAWSLFQLGTGTFASDDITVARPVPPPIYDTIFVGIALVLLVTAVAVVGHQYLTRRTTGSRIILVAGVCLVLLSMGHWEGILGTTSPGLDKEILDPAQVGVRIAEESLVFGSSRDPLIFFGLKRDKKMFLNGRFAPDPLPPDVAVLPAQISARLVLPSGKSLANHLSRSNYAFNTSGRFFGPLHLDGDSAAILRQALRGTTLLTADGPVGPHRSELLALGKDLHDRHRGIGMLYSARVDFLVLRNAISALRLEKGARYQWGSDWVAIVKVDPSFRNRGHLIVHLNEFSHRLMQDGRKHITYLLINRSRRQALAGWDQRDSLSVPPLMSSFFPMLQVRRLRLRFSPPRSGPPIGPDWYDGAELIRVETRALGWFSKSVRLEDLVMERIARSSPEAPAPGADG